MRRILTLITGLTLICSPAFSAEPFRPESALDLIQIPWKQLGYDIVFMPPRPGFRAMTLTGQRRIEVYARPQDDTALLVYDIAHEIGHAIDVTYNTARSRKEWMQARGINSNTQWFGCDRCSDYKTPAGDFAETYAAILCGSKYFRGRIAPLPSAEGMAKLAHFFPKDLLPPAVLPDNLKSGETAPR